MNNKLFSIGEVSKLKGVTIKALRYYQKMDIIKPLYIDENNGYRYYSIEQFIHIDIIKACRSLGVSIKELQEVFKVKDTKKLMVFLENKKKEAEENIEYLQENICKIEELKDMMKFSNEAISSEDIKIKEFEDRKIIKIPCEESDAIKQLMYYSNFQGIINDNNIKVGLGGIIYSGDINGLKEKYMFSFLEDNEIKNKKIYTVDYLSGGKYLLINYTNKNKLAQFNKLKKYILENNIKVYDYIEIDLIDDIFSSKTYGIQVQIRIT